MSYITYIFKWFRKKIQSVMNEKIYSYFCIYHIIHTFFFFFLTYQVKIISLVFLPRKLWVCFNRRPPPLVFGDIASRLRRSHWLVSVRKIGSWLYSRCSWFCREFQVMFWDENHVFSVVLSSIISINSLTPVVVVVVLDSVSCVFVRIF